jgi:hypothetical protein
MQAGGAWFLSPFYFLVVLVCASDLTIGRNDPKVKQKIKKIRFGVLFLLDNRCAMAYGLITRRKDHRQGADHEFKNRRAEKIPASDPVPGLRPFIARRRGRYGAPESILGAQLGPRGFLLRREPDA